jgi:hypothetical protein
MQTTLWRGPAADQFQDRCTGLLSMIARAADLLDQGAEDCLRRAAALDLNPGGGGR